MFSGRWWGGQRTNPTSVLSQLPQTQNNPYDRVADFDWQTPNSFTGNHQEQGRDKDGFFLSKFQKKLGPANTLVQISGLQKCAVSHRVCGTG